MPNNVYPRKQELYDQIEVYFNDCFQYNLCTLQIGDIRCLDKK